MPRHPVQPPEWIDAAPTCVEVAQDIAAPPEAVWQFIADHEGWSKWFTDLTKVEVTTGATGVGGGRRVFIGKLSIDEEFTAWDVNEHFAFAIVESKLPILAAAAESVRLEPTDAGCRVTYRQGWQGRPGTRWLFKVLGKRFEGQLTKALGNLKSLAEQSA